MRLLGMSLKKTLPLLVDGGPFGELMTAADHLPIFARFENAGLT